MLMFFLDGRHLHKFAMCRLSQCLNNKKYYRAKTHLTLDQNSEHNFEYI